MLESENHEKTAEEVPDRPWKLIAKGKVRDVYESPLNRMLALVASDRVSAFDSVIENVEIPDKGAILTEMSEKWCEYLYDEYGDETAMIRTNVNGVVEGFEAPEFKGRVTLQRHLKMFPIEFIVRGFITGSAWKDYQAGERDICGNKLQNGMQNCQQFLTPIFTPTTKAPKGQHDENITFDEMVDIIDEAGMVSANCDARETAEDLRTMCLDYYDVCYKYALQHGIIIADTKFEIGIDSNGYLVLADEVMTPDSSRFWPVEGYQIGREQKSLDKQIIRDYVAELHKKSPKAKIKSLPEEIIEETSAAYAKVLQMLFG